MRMRIVGEKLPDPSDKEACWVYLFKWADQHSKAFISGDALKEKMVALGNGTFTVDHCTYYPEEEKIKLVTTVGPDLKGGKT